VHEILFNHAGDKKETKLVPDKDVHTFGTASEVTKVCKFAFLSVLYEFLWGR
jgi:hypothetical protein